MNFIGIVGIFMFLGLPSHDGTNNNNNKELKNENIKHLLTILKNQIKFFFSNINSNSDIKKFSFFIFCAGLIQAFFVGYFYLIIEETLI